MIDLPEYSEKAQISEPSGKMLRVRKPAIWQSTLPKAGSPPDLQNSDLQSTLAKQGFDRYPQPDCNYGSLPLLDLS